MGMPSGSMPAPGPFSRALAAEIRSAMGRSQVSGAELARETARSQTYLSKRLRAEVPFSTNDVEDICKVLGVDLLALLSAAVRASRRP